MMDPLEARRRFDEACEHLRPELHRFCTRMTGSPCDGEDVLQSTLIRAFDGLSELREGASLRSWLFRIAHNNCIDFLRARRPVLSLDEHGADDEGPAMDDAFERKRRVERALANIVSELPARERACLILKDVLDCSLEETADITGSNVGAVKAALHRGRTRLEAAEAAAPRRHELPAEQRALAQRYIAAFNARDWDAVRALLSDSAALEVVHRYSGPFAGTRYLSNYATNGWNWRLELAWVDGEESVVLYREREGTWKAHSIILLNMAGGQVVRVRDFWFVGYLLAHSEILSTGRGAPA